MGKARITTIEKLLEENRTRAMLFFSGICIDTGLRVPCAKLSIVYPTIDSREKSEEAVIPLTRIYGAETNEKLFKELGRKNYETLTGDRDIATKVKNKLQEKLGGRTIYPMYKSNI